MPPMPGVLAIRGVSQQEVELPPGKERENGILHRGGPKWNLAGTIIHVPHRANGAQPLQGPVESWGPVRVLPPAKAHNARRPFGVAQEQAPCPEGLIIGVGHDDRHTGGLTSFPALFPGCVHFRYLASAGVLDSVAIKA